MFNDRLFAFDPGYGEREYLISLLYRAGQVVYMDGACADSVCQCLYEYQGQMESTVVLPN